MAWNSQQPMNSIPQRNIGGPTGVTQVGATGGAAGAGGGPMMQQGYMQQQQQGCCCQTDPNQQQQQGCFTCCDQTQQQQQQGCCQTDPNAPQDPMGMNLPLCVALFLFVSSVAGLGAIIGTYDREENLFSKLDAAGSKASDLQTRIYEQLGTAPTLDDEIRFHENALAALRKHVSTPVPDTPVPVPVVVKCDVFTCPAQYILKASPGNIACGPLAADCTRDKCCDKVPETPIPMTPAPKVFNCDDGFTCPAKYILKASPGTIDCGTGAADCTRDKCCDKEYTCAKYECGAGLVSKPNKPSISCGANECEDTNCCLTEILCDTHTCGAAFIDKDNKDTLSCGATTCTNAMCCDAKIFCDSYDCGVLLDREDKGTISCGIKTTDCSDSKCCQAQTDVPDTPAPKACPECVTPTVVPCEPCVPCTNETDPVVVPSRAAEVLAVVQPGGGAVPYMCTDSVEVLGSGGSICRTTDANFMMLYIARAQTFRALLYFLVALFSAIWLFYYCFVRMYTSEVHGAPDPERAEELKGLMSVAHGAIAFWSFWFIVVELYFYLKFNKFYRNNSGAELESFWRKFDDGFMTSVFLVAAVICWPMIAYVLEWILFAIFGCFGAMCAPGMQTYPQGGQAPGSMMRGGMNSMAGQEDCCAQMVKDWGNMPTSSIWQFLTRENGSSIAALQAGGGARPAGTGVVAVRPTLSNLDDDVEMQPSQQHLGGPGHHQQQPPSHLNAPPTQLMGVPVETPQQFGLNPQHARPQSSMLSQQQQQQNPVSQYPGAGASVAQGFPRPPSGQIAPHADDEFTLKPRPSSDVRPVAAAKVVKAAESDLEYSEPEPEVKKSSSRKDKRDKKDKHRRRKGDDSPSDRDDGKKEHKEKKEKKSRRSKDEDGGEKRERRRRSHSKGADDEDGGEKRERRRRSHSKDKKDKKDK